MSAADVPASIVRLRAHLIDRGFVSVLVSADRGHWVVAVRTPTMTRWIVPGAWEAYLDSREMRGLSIDAQVDFVETRLTEAVEACAADPGAEAVLAKIGERFMRVVLGLSSES